MKTLKDFFAETLIFVFFGPLVMLLGVFLFALALALFALIIALFALILVFFLPFLICVLWTFIGLMILKKYLGVKTFGEVAKIAEHLLNSSEDEENS